MSGWDGVAVVVSGWGGVAAGWCVVVVSGGGVAAFSNSFNSHVTPTGLA